MHLSDRTIIWVDTETTGLYHDAQIIEIALCIERHDPVHGRTHFWHSATIQPTSDEWLSMPHECASMHESSGLASEVIAAMGHKGSTRDGDLWRAQVELIGWMRHCCPQDEPLMWGGTNIAAFDLPLIRRQMPGLADLVPDYPILDLHHMRNAWMAAGLRLPDAVADARAEANHRAVGDVESCMAEWDAWRAHLTTLTGDPQ